MEQSWDLNLCLERQGRHPREGLTDGRWFCAVGPQVWLELQEPRRTGRAPQGLPASGRGSSDRWPAKNRGQAGRRERATMQIPQVGVMALPPSLDSEKDFLTGERSFGPTCHSSKTNFLQDLLGLCLNFPT